MRGTRQQYHSAAAAARSTRHTFIQGPTAPCLPPRIPQCFALRRADTEAAYLSGLSLRERQVIGSLVDLTRQLEEVDREFTAQMLSMECRMTGALVNYGNCLSDDNPLEALSPTVSNASVAASEVPCMHEVKTAPQNSQPHQLVNDLVLLDRWQLSPSMPSAVGNVDRSASDVPDMPMSSDDTISPADSDDTGDLSPASPLICTPDAVVNVSASPAPPSASLTEESNKANDPESVSYFDFQPAVQSF